MIYKKSTGTSGSWLKAEEAEGIENLEAKFVSEVQDVEGEYGKQSVGKIRIEGDDEAKNVRVNKTSINGLIDAFGEDSKEWIGKSLYLQVEKAMVSNRRVKVLYIIPQGHELLEDENGYLVIKKKGDIPVIEG